MRSKLANDKRYWLKLLNTDVSRQKMLDYHTKSDQMYDYRELRNLGYKIKNIQLGKY